MDSHEEQYLMEFLVRALISGRGYTVKSVELVSANAQNHYASTTVPTSNQTKRNGLARMRTAAGALEEIKKEDPDTELTLYHIRRLILSGKIPHINAGVKNLIDVDQLLQYLSQQKQGENELSPNPIRKVTP